MEVDLRCVQLVSAALENITRWMHGPQGWLQYFVAAMYSVLLLYLDRDEIIVIYAPHLDQVLRISPKDQCQSETIR